MVVCGEDLPHAIRLQGVSVVLVEIQVKPGL